MSTRSFQRARSQEQREKRRDTILATAADALGGGISVRDLSLNELARRVGLAKSNILRYFESREAILLTLLDQEYGTWLDEVRSELGVGESATTPMTHEENRESVEEVADVLSRTLVAHPVLNELVANAQLVLEQNVSAEVAADYKRRAVEKAGLLVSMIDQRIGSLTEPSWMVLASGINAVIAGVWGQCRPSQGMSAAYEKYPELASLRLNQRAALRELFASLLVGLLARPAASISATSLKDTDRSKNR